MYSLRIVLCVFSILMLVFALDSGAAQDDKRVPQGLKHTAVTKIIEQRIKQYQTALNNGNVGAVLDLYGSDPVFMPQHSVAKIGREQVQDAYRQVFNLIELDIRFSIYDIEYFGELAYARTSSAGKTRVLTNNRVVDEGNNELFIFRREQGEWKIHRYLFSTTVPRQ